MLAIRYWAAVLLRLLYELYSTAQLRAEGYSFFIDTTATMYQIKGLIVQSKKSVKGR